LPNRGVAPHSVEPSGLTCRCLGMGPRPIIGLGACGALLLAACGNSTSGASSAAHPSAVSHQYLAIAVAGNRHLEHDFDGLRADHGDLALARAYLRDAAATERLFDRRLLGLRLPASGEVIARQLVSANEARARLADKAAASATLAELRGYEPRLTAANAPVEDAVRVIRSMLGLPPPETS
jgi:hypothetical protein